MEDLLDQVICGDCLTVMKAMPEKSVHLAITSPPYNVGVEYDLHNDNLDYAKYLGWLNEVWKELIRVLVDGGRFALNIAPTSISDFCPVHIDLVNQLRDLGMIFRTEILWYKQSMTARRTAWGSWQSPSNPHIIPSWEYVYIFSKGNWRLDGDKNKIDITAEEFKRFSDGFWHIPAESQRNGHPAPFPEELIYRLIKYYSYQDNVILDMFGGTGTVAAVAYKTKRKYIHIDISEQYCQLAAKRLHLLKIAESQLRLLEQVAEYTIGGDEHDDSR
ncbi:MAG: site-specific DNA-methyltransferase [Anaerolineae bacterium]